MFYYIFELKSIFIQSLNIYTPYFSAENIFEIATCGACCSHDALLDPCVEVFKRNKELFDSEDLETFYAECKNFAFTFNLVKKMGKAMKWSFDN